MKRIFLLFLVILILPFSSVNANEKKVLKVGMEAAYAPYNWTQSDDSNGAVPIENSLEFANGYDVQIAKIIAEELGMEVVVVKTEWDGLAPAVQSGKIDLIIAGMSPTEERKKQIDFTTSYYESKLVMVVLKNSPFSKASNLQDFKGARVVGQLNTFHDSVIDQIKEVEHITPMSDFSTMRVALESGKIDAYVTEKPEAISAEIANENFKMIELKDGFVTKPEDTQIAIGLKKNSPLLGKVNEALKKIPVERQEDIMNKIISGQLKTGGNIWTIFIENKEMFARGVIYTLLISFVGTIFGLLIGMFVGVIRTIPNKSDKNKNLALNILKTVLNIYVQIFRATPMIVQAMIFYYGLQQFFNIDLSPLVSAFVIVSINTGAYMSEVVRGGIISIDKGQFEASKSLGMSHFQTMIYVILPQAFKNSLPSIGNEFIVNIKDTSVLNVISVQELFFTTKSIAGANFRYFETYIITSIIYLILTLGIASILHIIEKKLVGDKNYEKISTDVMKSSN